MNTTGLQIGYARVSTEEQDYRGQEEALKQLGCSEDQIFAEKVSGADKDGRPELQRMIHYARKGDTVHVTKLDRLARNAKDVLEIADQLQKKGAGLIVHDIGGMDINSDVGRLIYTVLAAVAEMERKRIRERQREGIAQAKADGRHLGRYEALDDEQKQQVRQLVSDGVPKAQLAKQFQVSRTTIYKALTE
jgi:DNA invertase Pin-like site-specific DNA recombinase